MPAHSLYLPLQHRAYWRWLVCAAILLVACQQDAVDPPDFATGPVSEPAAAIYRLAEHLQRNDLAAYARAAIPPQRYAELETAWASGYSRWPLSELPLSEHLPALLAHLAAENASEELKIAFRTQIAKEANDLRSTAQFIALWARQYLRQNESYTPSQRAHYQQVIAALSDWAQTAPFTDPWRANNAISHLTAAARITALDSDEAFQRTGMHLSLVRMGPSFSALKRTLADYGLSIDGALVGLRAELVQQSTNQAIVRVRYPLAEKNIDFHIRMERHRGKWYPTQTLHQVDDVLAYWHAMQPSTADSAPTPPSTDHHLMTHKADAITGVIVPEDE